MSCFCYLCIITRPSQSWLTIHHCINPTTRPRRCSRTILFFMSRLLMVQGTALLPLLHLKRSEYFFHCASSKNKSLLLQNISAHYMVFDHMRLNLYCDGSLLAVRTNRFRSQKCEFPLVGSRGKGFRELDGYRGKIRICHIEDLVGELMYESRHRWHVTELEKHPKSEYAECRKWFYCVLSGGQRV